MLAAQGRQGGIVVARQGAEASYLRKHGWRDWAAVPVGTCKSFDVLAREQCGICQSGWLMLPSAQRARQDRVTPTAERLLAVTMMH